jgi:hypothetical protein
MYGPTEPSSYALEITAIALNVIFKLLAHRIHIDLTPTGWYSSRLRTQATVFFYSFNTSNCFLTMELIAMNVFILGMFVTSVAKLRIEVSKCGSD